MQESLNFEPVALETVSTINSKTYSTRCVAVTELSMALALFFSVCSRDRPGFEPSHGAHRQAALAVDGGFGHGPQQAYLQCLGRLNPLHEYRCSK